MSTSKSQFNYIKVRLEWVKIILACFRDDRMFTKLNTGTASSDIQI